MACSILWGRGSRISSAALLVMASFAQSACERFGPCAEVHGPIAFISSAEDAETGAPLDELWIEGVRLDGETVDPAWLHFSPDSGAYRDGSRIVCSPPCELPGGYGPRHGSIEVELDLAAPGYAPRTVSVTSIYETVETGPCGNYLEGTADIVVEMVPSAR